MKMTDGTIRRLRNWAVVLAGNLETFEMSPEKGDELADLLMEAAKTIWDEREKLQKVMRIQPADETCTDCAHSYSPYPGKLMCRIVAESREPGMHCVCWEPKKETEITSIAIWATKGIELAQKNGIAEETLCTMLKNAWNIQRLFETARKENDNE